eukprot:COSAG05_NODE_14633_length_391_cov_1.750000_2_plen_27_part_01
MPGSYMRQLAGPDLIETKSEKMDRSVY